MDQTIVTSPKQEKLMGLLGNGYTPAQSANVVGVTESYVSQLLSEDWFAQEVQKLKFQNLAKHKNLDDKYDTFEEAMLDKLEKMSKLLIKPMEIAKVLQIVNGAKRKSHVNADPATITQNIVNLNIPLALANKFVTNANNQVVEVSDATGRTQALVTVASGQLEGLSREASETRAIAGLDSIDGTYARIGTPETGNGRATEAKVPQTFAASALNSLAQSQLAEKGLRESLRSSRQVTVEDL